MKKEIWQYPLYTVVLFFANFAAKYAFDFCELNHIDLVKPMFVGLFVTCVMSLSTMKIVLPAALGVGSFFGEVFTQYFHLFK